MSVAQMALLYRLQELEQSLAQLKAQRENHRVVQDIAKLKDVLSKYERLEQAVDKQLKVKKLTVRQAEAELSGLRASIADIETKLYGGTVTHPKELGNLEAKLKNLRSDLEAAENEALEHMEAIERLTAQRRRLRAMASHLEQQLRAYEQKLVELSAQWDFAEEDLRLELEEVRNQVEPALLKMYEKRRSTTKGRPVAVVSRGVCGGCLTELPTLQRKVLGREIVSCERCHRLLYWPS